MRNAILFFTLTIFTVQFSLAQDIIVKRDQQEIQAKIIEIGQDQIKYRKKDHLDGPIYNIAKAEVFMILYQNGKRETFTVEPVANPINVSASTVKQEQSSQNTIQESTSQKQESNITKGVSSTTISDQSFTDNYSALYFGIGFGHYLTDTKIVVPPLAFKYEFAVSPKFSAGLYIGYISTELNYDYGGIGLNSNTTYDYYNISGFSNYHFPVKSKKLDPYVGIMLGYQALSTDTEHDYTDYTTSAAAGGVIWGAQIGANYYFNKGVGVFAELGYGVAILNVGLALRL